jgi:hypothetical protein
MVRIARTAAIAYQSTRFTTESTGMDFSGVIRYITIPLKISTGMRSQKDMTLHE